MVLIDEIQKFFLDKEYTPCPLTERLVKVGYQQISGGYIDRAKKEKIPVDYRLNTPSQYWHLMSYCKGSNLSRPFPKSIVCGELLFWMAEVSGCVPKTELELLLDEITSNILYTNKNRPFYDRRKWNNAIHKLCFNSICSVVESKHINIPQLVIEASVGRADCGGHLKLLCKYKGEDVYSYVYDEPMIIGLPEFYMWNGKHVRVVNGEEGLYLLGELPI